jgi:DNA invertase Pin-like site-specific DNA recombinase
VQHHLELMLHELCGLMKKPTENLIGYARVSTEEQSLEMQIDALVKAGVPRNNISVEKVSAARQKRPELDEILDGLRGGDTLVVWKMDRIARSLVDLLTKMDRISQSGASFRSITEQIDTTTPGGRLIFHVLGALAQFERDLIVERTRAGVKAAMARGVKFGTDPKLNEKQRAQAQKMRDNQVPIRTIAAHFNVSHNTIANWTHGPGRGRKKPK